MGSNKAIEDIEATLLAATKLALMSLAWSHDDGSSITNGRLHEGKELKEIAGTTQGIGLVIAL
jgi:hypothetical protein